MHSRQWERSPFLRRRDDVFHGADEVLLLAEQLAGLHHDVPLLQGGSEDGVGGELHGDSRLQSDSDLRFRYQVQSDERSHASHQDIRGRNYQRKLQGGD